MKKSKMSPEIEKTSSKFNNNFFFQIIFYTWNKKNLNYSFIIYFKLNIFIILVLIFKKPIIKILKTKD